MESPVLIGRDEICRYLRISKNTFYKLTDAGMPAEKKAKIWTANIEQLNDFFRVGKSDESGVESRP
ncbi:MAG: helix-turn-helix domain-containing protein [Desulfobacteraceae bacterium]|nr:helix-turn-helix domain-containing protein [Desulfobacteraceae bacterium]